MAGRGTVDHRPCTAERYAWRPLEQERRELAMDRREHANRERKVADIVGLLRSIGVDASTAAGMDDRQREIAAQIKIVRVGSTDVPVPSGRATEVPSPETWGMVVAELLRAEEA